LSPATEQTSCEVRRHRGNVASLLNLGPTEALADTVAKLTVGQEMTVKAFRTDKLKDMHYVAKSLAFDNTTVDLRDDAMRPVWAEGSGAERGPGAAQWRRRTRRWLGTRRRLATWGPMVASR
jgi:hypothetical protein